MEVFSLSFDYSDKVSSERYHNVSLQHVNYYNSLRAVNWCFVEKCVINKNSELNMFSGIAKLLVLKTVLMCTGHVSIFIRILSRMEVRISALHRKNFILCRRCYSPHCYVIKCKQKDHTTH